eukprot:gnl/MRDRNA2_/MRDRNA2_407755_c0_seq1.p1 gnl/MRDRNA2_/MRDRNA2_407755_c0~~gnl/MRDRNA2_/MRDRNA2_407755_c0_seq1.p1  ORF type:complete len:156 (+),score=26.40 gnl/MRDRNA2_/MRDRNA2_407755_c0_seq1:59-469(+)
MSFLKIIQGNYISLMRATEWKCWVGEANFTESSGNLSGNGKVMEICPGMNATIPAEARDWLENKYGVGSIEERITRDSKVGFHDIGCPIFDDVIFPFADDPSTIFFWVSNGASAIIIIGIVSRSCTMVLGFKSFPI